MCTKGTLTDGGLIQVEGRNGDVLVPREKAARLVSH